MEEGVSGWKVVDKEKCSLSEDKSGDYSLA